MTVRVCITEPRRRPRPPPYLDRKISGRMRGVPVWGLAVTEIG